MSDDNLYKKNENDPLSNVEETDEGLSVAEDDLVVSNEQDDASHYQLEPDGQYGLRFTNTHSSGAYEISSDNSFTPTSKEAQSGSANDAPTVVPSKTNDGVQNIYGLAEPILSESQTHKNDLISTANSASKGEKSLFSRKKSKRVENDSVSLEDLYARRQQDEQTEEIIIDKRPQLPERPFWDNLLKPFCSIETIIRLGLVSATAFIPLFFVTLFFTRTLSTQAQEMLEAHRELGILTAFIQCIWQDKIVFLMLCFFWGVFSTPYSFHIFMETAGGADDFSEWPEYSFLGGLGRFLWILCLIAFAGLPGALLFSFLGLNSVVGFTFSATALTPIFFLSCMQADALFMLITKDVAKSLKYVGKSWGYFFGISYAFLFGTIALTLMIILFAVKNHVTLNPGEVPPLLGTGKCALTATLLSLVLSLIPAIYLRVLGRLAWIIEDNMRKRLEENNENEEEFLEDD